MNRLLLLPGLAAVALLMMAVRELTLVPDARTKANDGRTRVKGADLPDAAVSFGLPDRIRRAGRSGEMSPRSLLFVKAGTALIAVAFVAVLSPLLPSRFLPVVGPAAIALGFFLPDLMLERAARRRHSRMINALPDALDLLAVSIATGKNLGAGMLDLLESGRGPLSRELAQTGEEMAWGSGQALALEGLKGRVGGKEIASLCATLERSRKLGSPLADQLRGQSTGLRRDRKRAIEEHAARAAPKIQLVIALVLVPSVLLMIAASLLANSDALLGGL